MSIATLHNALYNNVRSVLSKKTSKEPFRVDRKFPTLEDVQLDINNLHLSIGNTPILKGVTTRIPKNQVTCIVGPSGCGKSTLLRTINRLNDGTEGLKVDGEIRLGSLNILNANGRELTELRRYIGLVPQRPCPLPMNIFDIVRHYLQSTGLWDEVKDRLHDPATALSGGQQQRLCLARSLAVEPNVILADEATSALDPPSSKKIEDLFTSFKGRYTVIMVTHTLQQAMRIADYVIFMYEGKIIEQGKAYDIFHNPKEQLTSDYLFGTFS